MDTRHGRRESINQSVWILGWDGEDLLSDFQFVAPKRPTHSPDKSKLKDLWKGIQMPWNINQSTRQSRRQLEINHGSQPFDEFMAPHSLLRYKFIGGAPRVVI